MKYLFWNTQGKKINDDLLELVVDFDPNIIGIAEYKDDLNKLLYNLEQKGLNYYSINLISCERIHLITKFKPGLIEFLPDSLYYAMLKIPHPRLGFHIVGIVHLPSKKYEDEVDYLFKARELKEDIQEAERVSNNTNTVIFGDFNMNPFETGMVAASALHALSCKKIATIGSRKLKGKVMSMFYNPMWNLFGDEEDPPGTYYYNRSNQVNYYWNIFDQVIIRPTLLDAFKNDSLKIITETRGRSLVRRNGRPQNSDHLPLVFEIQ